MRSLRGRLLFALIGLVVVTAVAVGTISAVLVERSLRSQMVSDAAAAAEFNLGVLAEAVGLAPGSGSAEVIASGIVDRFLIRGVDGVWVEFPGEEALVSGIGVVDGPAAVSAELRDLVAGGNLVYEFVTVGGGEMLVVGGRYPPAGPDFYFAHSAEAIADATRRLVTITGAVSLGVAVVGGVVAWLLGGTLLQPVAAARHAAERVAGGDLDVRLDASGRDELGDLAGSFNAMAESLRGTIEALEDARARERRFVGDVSHELRTPLTSLVNSARMLADRLRSRDYVTEEDRAIASLVDGEVARMHVLVEDLLEISRLESDAGDHDMRPVDVGKLLTELVAARLPTARVSVELSGPVVTEPRSLERIVGNLVDNARVHAGSAEVTVDASVRDRRLEIEVADRGPGVAPADLDTIFDRFAMADPARQGGTGLGLAIARQHARRLGGDVTAQLRAGGGLRMIASIPVAEPLHVGDVAATPGR